MDRGIVIGSRVSTSPGSFIGNGTVERSDVLKWLLYWDKIAYTAIGFGGPVISGNHSGDIQYLESIGIFGTKVVEVSSLDLNALPEPTDAISMFGLSGNQFQVATAMARVHLAKELGAQTEEIWTIGQSGGEEILLPGRDQQTELIDVQLINCLPVPQELTSFEDILRFKEKYRGELERLRYALDVLRERILSSSDERRATDAAINEISLALADINSALNSLHINSIFKTISLYTQNPSISFWTALGGMTAAAVGIPPTLGVAGGIAAPTLFKFIHRTIQGGSSLPDVNSDFAYAFEVSNQLV